MNNKIGIDLHCHLDGSLSLEYIQSILGDQITQEDIQAPDNCQSLTEYLSKFDIPLKCMQNEEHLKGAAWDFMRLAARDNVRYIEVRFAPMLSVHEGLKVHRVIEAVLSGLEKGKEEYHIDYNVIVCAMRHHSVEDNLEMLKAARSFLGSGVCGADLAGDENHYPMKNFIPLFQEVKKMEMPFTIHAGECGSPENIKGAIGCGAARIGHGIAMAGRRDIQELCRRKHIGIEMCPISNLQTKAASIDNYPLRQFLDEKLLVTINTDNRTVSNTNLGKEKKFIQKQYGITEEDIRAMTRNAIEISFADDEVKNRLCKDL